MNYWGGGEGGGWPGQQYGRQIQETEKPRERTKALQSVVREVLAPKEHIYGQLLGAQAHPYIFSARFLQLAG